MPEHEENRGESGVCFGSHRLDLLRSQLWRGTQEVRVTGKVFAVLQYFVAHADQRPDSAGAAYCGVAQGRAQMNGEWRTSTA